MRARHTRYEVPGWGVGDLWTSEHAVLDHELAFTSANAGATAGGPLVADEGPRTHSGSSGARPLEGAASPPTGTVPASSARVGHGFVPDSFQEAHAFHVDPEELVRRFGAFLDGSPVRFDDVPLDLDWCTPFQHAVADTLRAVPRGEVVSYAELAALAGYPGAQRAVGTFCARNRFALLIPCHRVIAADGIGGYGSAGAGVKRRLLALEGVVL